MNKKNSHVYYFDEDAIEKSNEALKPGTIARVVNDSKISLLGGGYIELNNESFDWQVEYDEIINVVSGELIIKTEDQVFRAKPGEILLLTKGAAITYKSEINTKFFYAIHPVNWRDQANTQ